MYDWSEEATIPIAWPNATWASRHATKKVAGIGMLLKALCDVSSKSFGKGFCDWDQGLARQLAPYSAKVCLQLIVVTCDMTDVSL